MFIKWKSSFSVNDEYFDEGHLKIIKLINGLYFGIYWLNDDKNAVMAIVEKTLNDIAGYAKTHLRQEENFMERIGFCGLAQHKQEHQKFVNRIGDVQALLTKVDPVTSDIVDLIASIDLLNILRYKLKHILEMDVKIPPCHSSMFPDRNIQGQELAEFKSS